MALGRTPHPRGSAGKLGFSRGRSPSGFGAHPALARTRFWMFNTSPLIILTFAFTGLSIIVFFTLLGLLIFQLLPLSSTKTMSPDLSLQFASQLDLPPSVFTQLDLQI